MIARPRSFQLERYFAKYEFSVEHMLSCSDCDGLSQGYLLALADEETRDLWGNLKLGYTESPGMPLLRREIAGLYHGISPEDVLVVAPEEGIFVALNCILEGGGHAIVTFPGYQSLYEVARWLGCQVTLWEPDEERGWEFDIGFLEDNLRPDTRLIAVNFPHNPTGHIPAQEDFRRIVEIARQRNIHVLSDEMYRLLELDPADRLPPACELYPKAVSLFGMSKTFGMAGVRIGWLATQDSELMGKMAAFKDYTTICSSAPSEVLSLIALRNRDRIAGDNLLKVRRNVAQLESFFCDFGHLFSWVKPKGSTVCFPRLLTGEDCADFCESVIREAEILLVPSKVFDYGCEHFRLGFGRENLPEVLPKLGDYLNRRQAR